MSKWDYFQKRTKGAYRLAAGEPTGNNFSDLMTAMFAIYGVN